MNYTISSSRLSVDIALPNETPNTTTRFDRAGFIPQIVLDGKHRFCAQEPDGLVHPCTGGMGLCCEFQMNSVSEEVAVGEYFPKFGVGLIRKPDEKPYVFHRKYEDVNLFDVQVAFADTYVVFTTPSKPCAGYALRAVKTVSVEQNRLDIKVHLKNEGERVIDMEEYCHNFVTIDALPIGPGYRLELPSMKPQDGVLSETLKGEDRGYTFTGYNPKAAMSIMPESDVEQKPFSWTLRHRDNPAVITEKTSFLPKHVSIWCIDHIISPEVFHHIVLKPGEETEYMRSFLFDD